MITGGPGEDPLIDLIARDKDAFHDFGNELSGEFPCIDKAGERIAANILDRLTASRMAIGNLARIATPEVRACGHRKCHDDCH